MTRALEIRSMLASGPIAAGRFPEIAERIGQVFRLDLSGLVAVYRGSPGELGFAFAIRGMDPVLWVSQEYRGPHPDGDGADLVHWQPSLMSLGPTSRRIQRELERRARLRGWLEDLAPAMDDLQLTLMSMMPPRGTA